MFLTLGCAWADEATCLACLTSHFPECKNNRVAAEVARLFCSAPLPQCVCMDPFTHEFMWKGTPARACKVDKECQHKYACRQPTAWDDLCGQQASGEGSSGHGRVIESGDAFGVVEARTATGGSTPGHSTFHLALKLANDAANVYSIYGKTGMPLLFPPAWQQSPFGADIGGIDPLFAGTPANNPLYEVEYDSWLTLGMTEADSVQSLSAVSDRSTRVCHTPCDRVCLST